ncbi:MAG TPA: DUF948 domain-containing protein [Parachlamydiaceae bacterium]|nr:DUF948 domain-containing protein [Parachlamydiaceae bacterium]
MNIELSLTIIAVSFVILAVFAIAASIFLVQLLIVLKKTTLSVEQKVTPLIDEARKIVNIASDTSQLVKSNFEMTTPLFNSIGKISHFMEGFASSVKKDMHEGGKHENDTHENAITVNFQSKKGEVDYGDWAEWLGMGIVLIQKLRHRHKTGEDN